MKEEFDTLKEKIELYKIVKERLRRLRELEKAAGDYPVSESRETMALALMLLEKIRKEIESTTGESPDKLKSKLFREFLEGKEGEIEE